MSLRARLVFTTVVTCADARTKDIYIFFNSLFFLCRVIGDMFTLFFLILPSSLILKPVLVAQLYRRQNSFRCVFGRKLRYYGFPWSIFFFREEMNFRFGVIVSLLRAFKIFFFQSLLPD